MPILAATRTLLNKTLVSEPAGKHRTGPKSSLLQLAHPRVGYLRQPVSTVLTELLHPLASACEWHQKALLALHMRTYFCTAIWKGLRSTNVSAGHQIGVSIGVLNALLANSRDLHRTFWAFRD